MVVHTKKKILYPFCRKLTWLKLTEGAGCTLSSSRHLYAEVSSQGEISCSNLLWIQNFFLTSDYCIDAYNYHHYFFCSIALARKNFTLKYDTNIPRQVVSRGREGGGGGIGERKEKIERGAERCGVSMSERERGERGGGVGERKRKRRERERER